jgi:hypothetical protein
MVWWGIVDLADCCCILLNGDGACGIDDADLTRSAHWLCLLLTLLLLLLLRSLNLNLH